MTFGTVRELEARRQVERALEEGLATTPTGLLVLLETGVPVSRLSQAVLEKVERTLGGHASVHVLSEDLVALVCPGVSLFVGWASVEAARQPFVEAHVPLTVGLASWPMQGPSVTDVFGAAVAALVDERERQQRSFLEDVERLFEGEPTWMAGELLSA